MREVKKLNALERIAAVNRAAVVYVVCPENDNRPSKIGIAKSPKGRLSSINTGVWFTLTMPFKIWVEDYSQARNIEKLCHKELKEQGKHLRGEWFDITNTDAADLVHWTAMEVTTKIYKKAEDIPPRYQWDSVEQLELNKEKRQSEIRHYIEAVKSHMGPERFEFDDL